MKDDNDNYLAYCVWEQAKYLDKYSVKWTSATNPSADFISGGSKSIKSYTESKTIIFFWVDITMAKNIGVDHTGT